ncbi:hypothetical protein D3C80_1685450 [compost metagenome]
MVRGYYHSSESRAFDVTPNRITFTGTKSKKSRSVPISPDLYGQLPRKRGRLFGDC